ncbi:tryptophan synthase subunit alpha [bacterium]|nr:tryptophan synthase subunit alpha [bacterium]NCQ54817.1 tryptophan synthase subunit alpha [Candidatus Parcubacteria bacterium]NCS66861.1 tryptophan synthase subunit alpha [Candidatus Peregrinibacteria bacterium]NCS95807.1 tryptophan synthase subunit alpha [bacterium]
MNRYQQTFERLKKEDKIAFIPFWMLGDPNPEASLEAVKTIAEQADILELGLPFSDPLADGPTIQAAVNRSLQAGMNTEKCLEQIMIIRADFPEKPIGLLVYLNLVLQYGINRFFTDCKKTGIDSILIPEMPVEEIKLVESAAQENQIDLVFLLSTNTPQDRRQKIYDHSGGFVYTVSKPSITGAKTDLSDDTLALVQELKSQTDLPICVGFGISTPEHIKALKKAGADGAIIGSELINIYQKEGLEALNDFALSCASST